MTVNEPPPRDNADADDQHQALARKNRGVRFSDHEWDEVRTAAQQCGITPAEFVRDRILALVRGPSDPTSPAFPVHLTPLIERTFRYTYMLATRMRDDMTALNQRDALETLIAQARELQDELRRGQPE